MGADLFTYSLGFGNVEPRYMCQLTPGSTDWTLGTETDTLHDQYCSGDYNCKIDWSDKESLHNIIVQIDGLCAPKWQIGLLGGLTLLGVVVGCLTITKQGDFYGRRPLYLVGLVMNLVLVPLLIFSVWQAMTLLCLFGFGLSITARYYVGYTFTVEMNP